ncbi:hypothetical protein M405DRAFT_821014 [Rhizopogon salebrosus TDB-379]|nr:hypothetical protein M405DRAFT_821014 [Rhizopogon salebrosus TDB-379]
MQGGPNQGWNSLAQHDFRHLHTTKSNLQDPLANQAAAALSRKVRPAATRNGR